MTDKGKKKYGYKGKKAARPAVAVFKGALEEIKDHTFVFSQIKTKKWMISSREKSIEYAVKIYGGNKSASLELGAEVVVTGTPFIMLTYTIYVAYNKL